MAHVPCPKEANVSHPVPLGCDTVIQIHQLIILPFSRYAHRRTGKMPLLPGAGTGLNPLARGSADSLIAVECPQLVRLGLKPGDSPCLKILTPIRLNALE